MRFNHAHVQKQKHALQSGREHAQRGLGLVLYSVKRVTLLHDTWYVFVGSGDALRACASIGTSKPGIAPTVGHGMIGIAPIRRD